MPQPLLLLLLPLLAPPSPNMGKIKKKRQPFQHRQREQTIEQVIFISFQMIANRESHGRLKRRLWLSSQIICPFLFSCHHFPLQGRNSLYFFIVVSTRFSNMEGLASDRNFILSLFMMRLICRVAKNKSHGELIRIWSRPTSQIYLKSPTRKNW